MSSDDRIDLGSFSLDDFGLTTEQRVQAERTNLGAPSASGGEVLGCVASPAEIHAVLTRARSEGRDVTDAEFYSLLGVGPNPTPARRRLAVAAVRTVTDQRDRAVADLEHLEELVAERDAGRELRRLAAERPALLAEAAARELDALIADARDDGRIVDDAGEARVRAMHKERGLEFVRASLDAMIRPPRPRETIARVGGAAPVTRSILTADDERLIERYGLDRAAFIRTRERELAEQRGRR